MDSRIEGIKDQGVVHVSLVHCNARGKKDMQVELRHKPENHGPTPPASMKIKKANHKVTDQRQKERKEPARPRNQRTENI
jgi:hypothetical protein